MYKIKMQQINIYIYSTQGQNRQYSNKKANIKLTKLKEITKILKVQEIATLRLQKQKL